MSASLQTSIHAVVRGVPDRYDGVGLLWRDLQGTWKPQLRRVAGEHRGVARWTERASARAAVQAKLEKKLAEALARLEMHDDR